MPMHYIGQKSAYMEIIGAVVSEFCVEDEEHGKIQCGRECANIT